MIAVLVPVTLLAGGIATGVMLGNAIGPGELAMRLPYGRYVELITFMWPRYDPLLPLLNALALLLDAAIAVLVADEAGGTAAATAFGLAAALIAVLMVISVTRNVPINKYVTALDPAREPEDWARRDPRATWRRWNRVRVVLALASLVAALVGAAVLL